MEAGFCEIVDTATVLVLTANSTKSWAQFFFSRVPTSAVFTLYARFFRRWRLLGFLLGYSVYGLLTVLLEFSNLLFRSLAASADVSGSSEGISFRSCSSFFCVALSSIPRTNLSRMSESRKQEQKLHVFANSSVIYCSTLSVSLF